MDAIAFDPGFVGGRSSPSRTSPGMPAGGARAFEDFLPRDDSPPPAPIDRPRSSNSERPPAAAERPAAKSGTGTDTSSRADRPDDRSDNRPEDRDDAPPVDATAQAAAAPPPAKEPADPSGTAAGDAEGTTAAKPVSAPAGATPSGQAANASTATTPNAGQAPNPDMPGNALADMQAAGALDMAPGETADTGGKTAAQPQNGATPVDDGTPTFPGLPADVAESAEAPSASVSTKAAPTSRPSTQVAAQQGGDAAGSPAGDSGLQVGARNNPSARTPQAGTQQPSTPAAPAVGQAADPSGDPNGSPDALTFSGTGDGDLSPASTGQSLTGTPSSPTQAAHGATAAGHRPIPTPTMLAEQIAVHIQRGMERGTDRIDIRLTPAELGRIEVRLELGHDGRVHAAIAVDRAETLDLLQRDARSLERALQDAGLKTDSGGLTFNLRGDGRQHSNTGFAANQAFAGNGPERSEPDAVAPEVAANIGERRIHLDGVVDIRV